MYSEQTINHNGTKVRVLFDDRTTMPVLLPLFYSTFQLRNRALNTQQASLIAVKFWYEYWFQKYGATYCQSFFEHNFDVQSCGLDDLDDFATFLRLGRSSVNVTAIENYSLPSNLKPETVNSRLENVCKFLVFLCRRYISTKYADESPLKLRSLQEKTVTKIHLQSDVVKQTIVSRRSVQSCEKGAVKDRNFKSLAKEVQQAVHIITRPSSTKKTNPYNPFLKKVQLRNYLIIKVFIDYGLRLSELTVLNPIYLVISST